MVGSFSNRERRSYPRFIIDLPLEYRDTNGPCLRGGIVVNASEILFGLVVRRQCYYTSHLLCANTNTKVKNSIVPGLC